MARSILGCHPTLRGWRDLLGRAGSSRPGVLRQPSRPVVVQTRSDAGRGDWDVRQITLAAPAGADVKGWVGGERRDLCQRQRWLLTGMWRWRCAARQDEGDGCFCIVEAVLAGLREWLHPGEVRTHAPHQLG